MAERRLVSGLKLPWFDPTPPTADECVIPRLLDRYAAETPDKVFIRYETGETWTWAETRLKALETAAALQARGVKKGDIVAAWAPIRRRWCGRGSAPTMPAPPWRRSTPASVASCWSMRSARPGPGC
jgi:acyl-CoA synthetase (AMP-forming)/AMP-acid ligase II